MEKLTEEMRTRQIERQKFGDKATSFFALEGDIRGGVKDYGLRRLKEKIDALGTGHEGNSRPCTKCGAMQRYKGDVKREIETEYGSFPLNRAYYLCPKCGHSCYPLDEKLGLAEGSLQGKLREIATMLCVLTPYESAGTAVNRIYGQTIDPKTLQRLVEQEGAEVLAADREEERRMSLDTPEGGAKTQEVVQAASGPDLLYLGIDGIMTPTRETRIDEGDQGHREAKVCRIFAEEERVEISRDRRKILGGDMAGRISNVIEFRAMVHCRFAKAGGHTAKKVIGLGDGAEWVWNTISEVAPQAVHILDFMHLMGHIHDAAIAGYGEANPLRHAFADLMEKALKKSRIDHVLQKLEGLNGKTKSDKKTVSKTIEYVIKNRSRIDYKTYLERGYDIGSGSIESTGKRLVGQRLKGCGMRWNRENANGLIALRMRWYNNQWDALWSAPRALAA